MSSRIKKRKKMKFNVNFISIVLGRRWKIQRKILFYFYLSEMNLILIGMGIDSLDGLGN
jgi:hypothetical protein